MQNRVTAVATLELAKNGMFGAPSFRWLPAKPAIHTSFLMFHAHTSPGFGKVENVRLDGTISIEDAGRHKITLRASPGFRAFRLTHYSELEGPARHALCRGGVAFVRRQTRAERRRDVWPNCSRTSLTPCSLTPCSRGR